MPLNSLLWASDGATGEIEELNGHFRQLCVELASLRATERTKDARPIEGAKINGGTSSRLPLIREVHFGRVRGGDILDVKPDGIVNANHEARDRNRR